ncbi:cubilin-like isoform X2 [Erythrolamprus reginae]|uniref:cubilin-like isoform X2 n=1 Tax=Erythrolamprus reginae TaxID=121349 RepID=UPI00396C820A
MECLSFLPWILVTLLIFFGGNYGSDSDGKNRPRRNINQAQPRMSSEEGNLVFHTGSAKNIEFRTGSQGRIKLNEEDLADVFSQIQRNKDEILELKRLSSTHLNVSSEIIQLQSQIVNIEDRLRSLETTFFKNSCNNNPCQNSGTCINLLDAFFCICPNNWQLHLYTRNIRTVLHFKI